MKDTWRIDSADLMREGDIYALLHEKQVPHIMPVVCHGDVGYPPSDPVSPDDESGAADFESVHSEPIPLLPRLATEEEAQRVHRTKTQTFTNKGWFCGPRDFPGLHGYVHYRMVLEYVCRDLTHFSSSKEMVSVVKDAIEAHAAAFFDAGILHRDISPGNILIGYDGRGYLIDWDLSKPYARTKAVRYGWTGTWQFISAALLQSPLNKQHTLADDLESFLHVMTHTFLCYSPSTHSGTALASCLAMFDEQAFPGQHGLPVGGQAKEEGLGGGHYIKKNLRFDDRPLLHDLLDDLAELIRPLYMKPRDLRYRGVTKEQTEATLNTREGGSQKFIAKLEEALNAEGAWPEDDRANLIFVPMLAVSTPRMRATEKKRSRSDMLYNTSASYTWRPDARSETLARSVPMLSLAAAGPSVERDAKVRGHHNVDEDEYESERPRQKARSERETVAAQ